MQRKSTSRLLALLLFSGACGGGGVQKAGHTPRMTRAYPSADMAYEEGAMAAPEAGDSERYEHYPENPAKNTRESRLSTFALDVDTASYSNMRRFLQHSGLPPQAAVRTEEFINYFRYDYADPAGDAPLAIHSELSVTPWNPESSLLKIGIQGKRMDSSALPPRNLVFLIDVSGSMSSHDKLPLLKSGLTMLTETLREEDRVSIVVYAGAAGTVLPPTSGHDKGAILASLDRLQAGGSTNGGQGIELAYRLAEQNFDPRAVNRIILASDGDFNVGTTGKEALIELIEDKRESGVYLSVLGMGGSNLNDATMEQLADKGNGNYSYIDSKKEAHKVLVEEAASTLVTLAKDAKIQVDFDPERVESFRLVGYDNRVMADEDFDNEAADAGELGAGHSVTALYELVLSPEARSGDIAKLRLRYKHPKTDESAEIAHTVSGALGQPSANMRFVSLVAAYASLLRGSEHLGEFGWDQLLAMAERELANSEDETRHELLELIRKAHQLAAPKATLAQ